MGFAALMGVVGMASRKGGRGVGEQTTHAEAGAEPAPPEAPAAPKRTVPRDTTLVYRGTHSPESPQVSHALRDLPKEARPSESSGFLSMREGQEHANHGRGYHPDGVSVTTNAKSAGTYGTHVIEYVSATPSSSSFRRAIHASANSSSKTSSPIPHRPVSAETALTRAEPKKRGTG